MSASVRYGLIGSGMMAQEHIRNLALIPGAEVAGYADPDAGMRQTTADLTGDTASAFEDYRDLLSADICDAYIIAGPNDLHHKMLIDTLPAGKPILCEKPLCTTVADCRDIIQRADSAGVPVWVAMEYRFMPPAQRLLAELSENRVGTPRMFAIREHRYPFLPKVGDWNRFSARTGGTLVEKCCHFWDLMRLVLQSDPVRVYASANIDVNHLDERYGNRVPDIIDNAFCIVDFASGARGMLDLCMFAEGSYWQELLTVTGDKARIEARIPGPARFSADESERHAEIVVSERASRTETTETVQVDKGILKAGDHHGSTYYQHRRFFDMVRSGSTVPDVTLQDGFWSVLVGEAAETSAREGRAVDIDPQI